MRDPAASVDEFLAALLPDQREALEHVRATIRSTAPDAVELINYGVPAFKLDGRPLVSLGAGKGHCSFYVQSPAVLAAHAVELAAFDTTKGTIHFSPASPIPDDLVTRLVQARIAENHAARRSGDR